MQKRILLQGVVFTILAVILGAFGAHALKAVLSDQQLESYHTATRYLMYHGLALLILIAIQQYIKHQLLNIGAHLIFWGTLLFSGSIILLVCRNLFDIEMLKILGPITPLGGSILIIGWICILIGILKKKAND